jgi:two-component system sensor histidine kinase KdpD
MADQLVNVDLSAEDLRERLQAGKVYPAERVASALENFFTPGNLSRLRELTLGEMAHLLDRRRREQGGEERSGSDRVMVCLSSRSPDPEALLRKGARLADRLSAPWYAVYIQTPGEEPDRVAASVQRQTGNTLALAHQLGAVPMTFKGSEVVGTIAAFVKEYGITHVLLGRSQRPWYRRWFGQSVLDRLLRAIPAVDVIVVGSGG